MVIVKIFLRKKEHFISFLLKYWKRLAFIMEYTLLDKIQDSFKDI